MFVRKDITDLNPNENLHEMANELMNYMVNDLIFTSAGELMKVIVEKKGKKGCGNDCECQDCDDDHGDNVTW